MQLDEYDRMNPYWTPNPQVSSKPDNTWSCDSCRIDGLYNTEDSDKCAQYGYSYPDRNYCCKCMFERHLKGGGTTLILPENERMQSMQGCKQCVDRYNKENPQQTSTPLHRPATANSDPAAVPSAYIFTTRAGSESRASCAGTYWKDDSFLHNGKPVYVNLEKPLFIVFQDGKWWMAAGQPPLAEGGGRLRSNAIAWLAREDRPDSTDGVENSRGSTHQGWDKRWCGNNQAGILDGWIDYEVEAVETDTTEGMKEASKAACTTSTSQTTLIDFIQNLHISDEEKETTLKIANDELLTTALLLGLTDAEFEELGLDVEVRLAIRNKMVAVRGKFAGSWKKEPDEGWHYDLELEIFTDNQDNEITGCIVWTLRATPSSYYVQYNGKSAKEFVFGTYDAVSRIVSLEGRDKEDPLNIIACDKYNFTLSLDGMHLNGRSLSDSNPESDPGDWCGLVIAQRVDPARS